jgi:hypothetical protein
VGLVRAARSLALLAALAAPAAQAAPPAVPTTVPYQGLLLDSGGVPQSGSVDLTLRIYDALTGGTLLYKQALTAVPLTDGVFSVSLGPTGAATDAPANPLTTSLAEALAGDIAATGPSRFLEVTAGSGGPLVRTQIVSVPYSLHAASAESAAFAETAGDVGLVNGVPASVLSEIFEHVDFDGGEPPNTSPLEGAGDVDGDGVANFLDPDNDGDGLADATEVTQGTGVNAITPIVSGVRPLAALSFLTTTVTVSGQNFSPGLSVAYGSQSPAATSVTPTSFQVAVGPQPDGPAGLLVTLANGETAAFTGAKFFTLPSGSSHGMSVPAGAQLSFDLTAGAVPIVGGVGQIAGDFDADGDFSVGVLPGAGSTAVTFDPSDRLASLRCRTSSAINCQVELVRKQDDGTDLTMFVETLASSPTAPLIHGPSIAFDPAGRPVLGYVKVGGSRTVTVSRDADGDGNFSDPGEIRTVMLISGSVGGGGDLAVDSAGRAAYAYHDAGTNVLRVAYDRNGDGDFSDTIGGNPENLPVTTAAVSCLGVSFDDGARLALVWGTSGGAQLARDANADGDFADAGELLSLTGNPLLGCDVDGAAAGGLAVVHDGDGLRLLLDRDDDGSFAGTDEDLQLAPPGSGNHPARVRQRGVAAAVSGTTFYFDPLVAP